MPRYHENNAVFSDKIEIAVNGLVRMHASTTIDLLNDKKGQEVAINILNEEIDRIHKEYKIDDINLKQLKQVAREDFISRVEEVAKGNDLPIIGQKLYTSEEKSSLSLKSLGKAAIDTLKQIQEKVTEIGQSLGGRGA